MLTSLDTYLRERLVHCQYDRNCIESCNLLVSTSTISLIDCQQKLMLCSPGVACFYVAMQLNDLYHLCQADKHLYFYLSWPIVCINHNFFSSGSTRYTGTKGGPWQEGRQGAFNLHSKIYIDYCSGFVFLPHP